MIVEKQTVVYVRSLEGNYGKQIGVRKSVFTLNYKRETNSSVEITVHGGATICSLSLSRNPKCLHFLVFLGLPIIIRGEGQ